MQAPVYVLYRNEGGDFAEAVALTTDEGKHLVTRDEDNAKVTERICTEPFAYDLDGDGDLDFIIGNFDGCFLQIMNVGSKTKPLFKGKPEFVTCANGERLRVQNGNHGAPVVVDWDGDGDHDILTGNGRGGVQLATNNPDEKGNARYEQFQTLIEAPKLERGATGILPSDTPLRMGNSWRITVADWNADGKLDVLVGDALNMTLAKKGDTVEQAMAKNTEWQKGLREHTTKLNELQVKMRAAEDDEAKKALQKEFDEAIEGYHAYYKTRAEYVNPVSTGHVWVYLQK